MEPKSIVKSRSLWATLVPVLALILGQFGVENVEAITQLTSGVGTAVITIGALVLEFFHQRKPAPTTMNQ